MKKIGIIGFGIMGSAFAGGLKGRGYEIAATDTRPERNRLAEDEFGLVSFAEPNELVSFADILVIAVKPQDLSGLLEEISSRTAGKRIISIVAGRKIADFQKTLKPSGTARFMPNLAAKVGKALIGVSYSDDCDEDFREECRKIAAAIGEPCEIPEKLMPAVTGLSGSGIAFVFAFLHAMAMGGVAAGIAYPRALEIALTTTEGAFTVVRDSGENPMEWLSRVISPAGTTIKGIEALEAGGFTATVMKAVEEAARRAWELEQ